MKKGLTSIALFLCVALSLFASPAAERADSRPAAPALNRDTARQGDAAVTNIIVMIPDGMSLSGLTLARWYKAFAAEAGTIDPSVSLALDDLASGLIRSWWSDGQIAGIINDSAPAATAYASGIKTVDGFIGMTSQSTPVATILQAARLMGKSTGLVATSQIQHATPAAFASHHNDRSRFDIIGEQQVYSGMDVVLGGGSLFLSPPYRQDSENLIESIRAMDYQYITTRDELLALHTGRVWGMFAPVALAFDLDREEYGPYQPSLAEMTGKAIELLSHNSNGFFLMVEGSKIDWAAHAQEPVALVTDILAFDAAVQVALDFARARQDTMLLIMSDHGTGGISIGSSQTDSSYPVVPVEHFIAPLKRARLTSEGIAGKLDESRSNIVEVISRYFGIDDLDEAEIAAIRGASGRELSSVLGPMMSRRAAIGWTTIGHSGEDVILFSYLPGDRRITGTLDNTDIAHICAGLWGIDLDALTSQLFIEAAPAFAEKGATVMLDRSVPSSAVMMVFKDDTFLEIPENKNYVFLNDDQIFINSVIVHQDGSFFVSQDVLDLIP